MTLKELGWINTFFGHIRKHLFVRREDGVLILPPNKVYKLNPTALVILENLLAGKRIGQCSFITPGLRARQVHDFFCDLKAFYQGCGHSGQERHAVDTVPYTFDFTTLPVLGELAVTYSCNNSCRFCYLGQQSAPPAASVPAKAKGAAESGDRPPIKCTSAASVPTATGDTPATKCTPAASIPTATEGTPLVKCTPATKIPATVLSLSQVKRIIDIFQSEAHLPFFSFTGGEPLLRTDLEKMVRYAVRRGLGVNLITNGTLLDPRRARSLARSGLQSAQVSLEGHLPALHDHLVGVPGAFERTIAGIAALQQAGVSVQTNTTVTRLNAPTLEELLPLLQEIGIKRFSMNLYIPSGEGCEHEALFVRYTEIGALIEKVRRRARALDLTFFWYSPLPQCHYNPLARGLGNKSCAAMDGLLSVSPSGDVLPCSSWPEGMGNLLKQDFRAIWFSARAAFFKQKQYAPPECLACGQFTACQAACPLYWRYAGTGELRQTCLPRREAEMMGV